MRFIRPEVIIESDDLKRRVLIFYLLEDKLVLDEDKTQHRKTKRHKWKTEMLWSRLDRRSSNISRRHVPQQAIDEALQQIKNSIAYDEQE